MGRIQDEQVEREIAAERGDASPDMQTRIAYGKAAVEAGSADQTGEMSDASDTIANILHMVVSEGMDPEAAIEAALLNFNAERGAPGAGPQVIYVCGFVSDGGIGGFQWAAIKRDAVTSLRGQLISRGRADIGPVKEVRIDPMELVQAGDVRGRSFSQNVTRWLEEHPETWEPGEGERPDGEEDSELESKLRFERERDNGDA